MQEMICMLRMIKVKGSGIKRHIKIVLNNEQTKLTTFVALTA